MKDSVNILGTTYSIEILSKETDKFLNDRAGYCDNTSKRIVVSTKDNDCELDNFDVFQKKVLRHEIIHAFLYESGLHENFEHPRYGHEETMVDWFATQYSKINKAFIDVGCL